jgi:glycosyltransferase involved in cell wall biosynthesis
MKVIWFSEIKWSYLKTRKQQLIQNFPADWHILFIESYVAGKLNSFRIRKTNNVTYVTIPFFKGTPYALINKIQGCIPFRFIFSIVIRVWLKNILRKSGFNSPDVIIGTSNIFYADIIKRLKKRLMFYDCNDDPLAFVSALPFAKRYYLKTLQTADFVVTVSKNILDKIHLDRTHNTFIIGNGVDYDLFSSNMNRYPDDVLNLPRPLILYTGAISDWFHLDLLKQIIESFRLSTIVLVGPILTKRVRDGITSLASIHKNLYWLGEKKYSELPAYVSFSDVCIIPFIKNELTKGLNPNKLYEYLACGKPVVTMDYSDEITALREYIFIAVNENDFITDIRRALDEKKDPGLLQSIARANSWKSKSEELVRLIDRHLVEKSKKT